MPPAARARSAPPGARDDADAAEAHRGDAPLVARLAAAADAGAVDVRQLADQLGFTAAALQQALARPATLDAEQAGVVAHALGVDQATMRALRRAPAAHGVSDHGVSDDAAGTITDVTSAPRGHAGTPPGPRSTLELLDAVLHAVCGDADGRALRAAVLDAAERAARDAGRPLPPGAHALRARLTRDPVGGAAQHVDTPDHALAPDTADDAGLVAAAAALVRDIQQSAPGYDALFAPLHDDALADLLRRHAVAVQAAGGPRAGTRLVLTPALFGRHRLIVPAAATSDQRRLMARAALAHLLAGHVDDATPLPSPAPPLLARLADLVALADLVPFWQLADARRRGRLGWRALAAHVAELAAGLAGDWGTGRCADRGALRVALFRAHQL